MIKSKIYGEDGTSPLKINVEGEASVVVHPHPPKDDDIFPLPFRAYFKNSSDSLDMNIDGSVTNVDFFVEGNPEYDTYIKYISVEISDTGTLALNKFGAENELSNGVEWVWFTQVEGEYQLHEGIKTNKEFIRIGTDTGAIGTGTDAYLADVSGGGTQKSYLPSIDISESYGLPWGLRLKKGSTDKIIFRVKDDLTGLSNFNIVCYGIRL